MGEPGGHFQIFSDGALPNQHGELWHPAEHQVYPSPAPVGNLGQIPWAQIYRPGGWLRLSGDKLKQGAFPGPAASCHKDKFPLLNGQIDLKHGRNALFFLGVILGYMF